MAYENRLPSLSTTAPKARPVAARHPFRVRAYDSGIAALARTVGRLSRALRAGGGTSIPGVVVERLDPALVPRRAERLGEGIVLVSGTNGKTTTTAMIKAILEHTGKSVISNESGANLFRGVATALLRGSSDAAFGVFEVDEMALPRLVELLSPRTLVLTNVFRDQLDRFGEPEEVARLLRRGAGALPPGATLISNADDPLLSSVVGDLDPVGFSVLLNGAEEPTGSEGDPEICARCGGPLTYRRRTVAHLGSAACRRCGWRSPQPDRVVTIDHPPGLGFMPLELGKWRSVLPVGGLHNAYNAAAAIVAAGSLGIGLDTALAALEGFHPRFGRAEELEFEGSTVWLTLMKNPGGAAAVIQQVAAVPRAGAIVVCVSDGDADGRDVSWIWDADFERLARIGVPIVAAGKRAAQVALRFKYAGTDVAARSYDPATAIRAAAERGPGDRPIVVLSTYTAMLDVRRAILGSRAASVEDRVA